MKDIIQKLADNGNEMYAKICEVVAIDLNEKTVDLQPLDGTAEIQDVFLMVGHENGGQCLEPEIGTLVCVVFISKETGVVVNYSQLKTYNLLIDDVQFNVSSAGFLIRKKEESLGKLMVDLLTEIRKMKFTTNTGSTILLVNEPAFVFLENRFKNLLKEN